MIWLLGYLAVAVVAMWPVTLGWQHLVLGDDALPGPEDWFLYSILGAISSLAWPLCLLLGGGFMFSRRIWTGLWRRDLSANDKVSR